jgi:uncharacterized membrane protein YphA (DoxX/SURF4 family)
LGLLLLRAAAGVATTAQGFFYLSTGSSPSFSKWALGLILIISGAALVCGFLTPFAGLCVALSFLGIAVSWFPAPSSALQNPRLMACGMIIIAVALSLLGPGAFSIDGRLFGRREIVIPPSSRSPER